MNSRRLNKSNCMRFLPARVRSQHIELPATRHRGGLLGVRSTLVTGIK